MILFYRIQDIHIITTTTTSVGLISEILCSDKSPKPDKEIISVEIVPLKMAINWYLLIFVYKRTKFTKLTDVEQKNSRTYIKNILTFYLSPFKNRHKVET